MDTDVPIWCEYFRINDITIEGAIFAAIFLPQVGHNSLPVFSCWAPKEGDHWSVEVTEVDDIHSHLGSFINLSEECVAKAGGDEVEEEEEEHDSDDLRDWVLHSLQQRLQPFRSFRQPQQPRHP